MAPTWCSSAPIPSMCSGFWACSLLNKFTPGCRFLPISAAKRPAKPFCSERHDKEAVQAALVSGVAVDEVGTCSHSRYAL